MVKKIQLGGHKKGYKIKGYALVDESDYEELNQYYWCLNGQGYAIRGLGGRKNHKKIIMHRLILGAKPGQECDHINENILDNRHTNLRICTKSQNMMNRGKQKNNTSGFKGVHWDKSRNKWQALIKLNGNKKGLGRFNTAKQAAKAYNKAAKKLFGEYANLNNIHP